MPVSANTTSFRKLLCLAALASPVALGAQTARQIHGVVRDSAGAAVPRAEASVVGDTARVVANDSGVFALPIHRNGSGSVVVRVRRLGYEPLEQPVTVPDTGSISKTFTLNPIAQSLAAMRVVAERRGLFGIVRDQRGVPLPDVDVQVLGGDAKPTKTDADGRFEVPTDKTGTFLVVARKKGYAYAQSAVSLSRTSGEEAEIVLYALSKANDLASGFGRMEFAFREASTRLAFKGINASVVTHDQLLERDTPRLSYALCGTQAQMRAVVRCPVQASCVILNGDHMSALPLDAFDVEEVETVEYYPAPLRNSDWSGTLATRGCSSGTVAVVWLRRNIK
jgi:hypothetical protein